MEVDRQQTNLTRFSLFFPERRYFFIENSDLFSNFGFSQIRPFFSRKIGLENGTVIPIYGGLRLSGKINKNWRIGIMNIQTARSEKANRLPENFTVAAFQRKIFARSNIAGIFVNKQEFDTSFSSLTTRFSRIAGLDYNLASKNNKFNGKAFFHKSFSDLKATNSYAHATWLNYSTQNITAEWNHEYVGENYNASVGFVPRQVQYNSITGQQQRLTFWRLEPKLAYNFYPKHSIINKFGPQLLLDQYANKYFYVTDRLIKATMFMNFTSSAVLTVDVINNYTKLLFPTDVTFTGKTPLSAGAYQYQNAQITFKTNVRKTLNGLFVLNYGTYFTGNKLSYSGEVFFRKQPYAILSLAYNHDEIYIPGITGKTQLNLIGPKVELSFTKSIFFTTFLQYNSQIENFNINSRLQWRFKPMSDFYIVYTDNYNSVDFGKKNKALILKFIYWINV